MDRKSANSFIDNDKIEEIKPTFKYDRQFVVNVLLMLCVFIGAASSGMAMGYPAVLLPQLNSNNSTLKANDEMGSWIASILSASMPIGSIISGILSDKIGRKLTLHLQTSVVILGWVLVAAAQSHAVMLVGRFVSGVASGLGIVACQVYMAEVSTPAARGILTSAPFVSYALGILVVYALGAFLQWRLVAGLSTICAIISIIMYFMYPESHVWLIRQGKIKKATDACIWFRGNNVQQAHKEIEEIITRFKNEKIKKYNWNSILQPYTLKPLVITATFNLLQALSGVYVVVFYSTDIIINMKIENLQITNMFIAVLTAITRLVFSFVACFLLRYMKRRSLAILSGFSTFFFSTVLAICLNYKVNSYFMPICLLFYVAASTVGLLILPGIMIGELFPARVRGVAGGLTYTLFSIFTFVVTKAYPFLKANLQMFGLFHLFGLASFILCLLVYFTVPETKNKTLHDIEDYFMQPGIMWSNKSEKKRNETKTCDEKLNSLI